MRPANNGRDSSIERLLQQTARAREGTGPTSSCPDSEALSAWAEEGLLAGERSDVEAHLGTCARCQAILAAMVRAEPPAVLPERWWRRRFVPILVPLAAATVVAVWLTVPRHEPPSSDDPATTIGATRPQTSDKPVAPPAEAEAPARPSENAAASSLQREKKLGDQVARQERRERNVEDRKLDRKDSGRLNEESRAGRVASEKPSAAAAAPPVTGLRDERLAARISPVFEIVSADASRRWRVTEGVIQRSTDGGSTWITQESAVPMALTAGSSPSPDVCWIVGRAGAVLISADGRSWRRLRFPEAVDLVGVRAIDASTATVTAADGRSFITKDAGLTWVPGSR